MEDVGTMRVLETELRSSPYAVLDTLSSIILSGPERSRRTKGDAISQHRN
jgi:hypothetical protein